MVNGFNKTRINIGGQEFIVLNKGYNGGNNGCKKKGYYHQQPQQEKQAEFTYPANPESFFRFFGLQIHMEHAVYILNDFFYDQETQEKGKKYANHTYLFQFSGNIIGPFKNVRRNIGEKIGRKRINRLQGQSRVPQEPGKEKGKKSE